MAEDHNTEEVIENLNEEGADEVVVDKPTPGRKQFIDLLAEKRSKSETPEEEEDVENDTVDEKTETPAEEEEDATEEEVIDLAFLRNKREQIGQLLELERQLTDKDSAPAIFKALASGVAQLTGLSVKQLLGEEEEVNDEEGDFETTYEQEIYERAKRAALKEFQKEFTPLQEKLSRLEQAEQTRDSERQLAAKVEQGFGNWAARIEKETGFKPTRSQVEQALKSHPNLDPIEAIKLANLQLILKIQSKEAIRSAPKAHTIAARSAAIGKKTGSPKNFIDLLLAKREKEADQASSN